jgi:CBS domain-containing protein
MTTARQVLSGKPPGVISVAPDTTVFEALKLMATRDIGALVVLDNGKLVGVLSERDYTRKIALQGKTSRDTLVREIMSDKVICIAPQNTVDECMALMTDKHIRHLPVLENDTLLGVLSIRDLVQETISHQRFIIEQLELYIGTGQSHL